MLKEGGVRGKGVKLVFDLLCVAEHQFEGWFDLAGDFASQRDLSCLVSAPPDRLSPE
jgi:hypothetical protein